MAVLDTHLWALRAEVEAQLRTLTEIHRQLNHLPGRDDPQWAAQMQHIESELGQLFDACLVVRELSATALHESYAVVQRKPQK